MYSLIANHITNYFIIKKIISEDKATIYKYGFEILISSIVYIGILLVVSILSSTFIQSILFFVSFFIARSVCGGFHANTYFKCHLLFSINHILVILLLYILKNSYYALVPICIFFLCSVIIFIFAPVDHKNKRFIKTEFQRFRRRSVIYSLFLLVFAIVMLFVDSTGNNNYILSFSFGTLSATISLLCAKLINIIERKKENEKQKTF